MKKSSNELATLQDQAAVRLRLLKTGRIRLIKEEPKPPAPQEKTEGESRESDSR